MVRGRRDGSGDPWAETHVYHRRSLRDQIQGTARPVPSDAVGLMVPRQQLYSSQSEGCASRGCARRGATADGGRELQSTDSSR